MRTVRSFLPVLGRKPYGWLAISLLAALSTFGQELKITQVRFLPSEEVEIEHESDPTTYFILDRSDRVDRIETAAKLALGQTGRVRFVDRPTGTVQRFYRLRRLPLTNPLDVDKDGIDDVYELRRPATLDPLNPADASLDADADGESNLAEYRAGTDPALPDYALTVRVVDTPVAGSASEFRELGDAVAHLNVVVPAGRQGRVLVSTDRELKVASLDLVTQVSIEVDEAFQGKARLAGPGGSPLVITASRGLAFNGFRVANAGGVVFHSPLRFRLLGNSLPATRLNLGSTAGAAFARQSAPSEQPASGGGLSTTTIQNNTFLGAFDVTVGANLSAGSSLTFLQNRGPALNLDLQGSVAGEVSLSDEVYQRTGIQASLILDGKFTISHLQDAEVFEFKGYATGKPQLHLENSVTLQTSLNLSGIGEFSTFLRYCRGQHYSFDLGARRHQVDLQDSEATGDLKLVMRPEGGVAVQETRLNLNRVIVGANLLVELAENENSRLYANLGTVNGLNLIASLHGSTYWEFGDGVKLSGHAAFTLGQGLLDVNSHGAVFQGGIAIENQHVRATVAGRYERGSLGPGLELDAPQGIGMVTLEFLGCDFLSGGSIGCWGPEPEENPAGGRQVATLSSKRPLTTTGNSQVVIRNVKSGLKKVNVFDLKVPVAIENCVLSGKGDIHISNVEGPVTLRDLELTEGSVLVVDDALDCSVTVERVRINGGLAPSLTINAGTAEVKENRVTGTMAVLSLTVGSAGTITDNILAGDNAGLHVDIEGAEVSVQGNQVSGIASFGQVGSKGQIESRDNVFDEGLSISGGRVVSMGDTLRKHLTVSHEGVLDHQGDLSGLSILDLNFNGGLVTDPVKSGADPNDVITFVDFDGDSCADYPPPQRILGMCVRPGVPPPP